MRKLIPILAGLLTVIFIVLKANYVIKWSLLWVFSPLLILVIILIILYIIDMNIRPKRF